MIESGTIIEGKYKVLSCIGHGGQSNVYLVLNEKANKSWALKEVRKDGGKDPNVLKNNLRAEASILMKLRHPNLPSIIDIIEQEDSFLILMDYIEGITLQKKLEDEGVQDPEHVVKWSIQIASVLHYLHSQDPPIIYRDTKPANIMLKPDGNIMLIDFGTAREYKKNQTLDTTPLGTEGFAAPEQYEDSEAQTDARTDVYGIGATMYYLLTGRKSTQYITTPILSLMPDLSTGLAQIITKCTQLAPEDRYKGCADLIYALEHYTDFDNETVKERKKKIRRFFICVTAALICLGIGAATRIMADNMTSSSYSQIIKNAQTMEDTAERERLYIEAMDTDPTKETAYAELLEKTYLSDGVYSREEAENFIRILNSTPAGMNNTRENYLKQDTAGYGDFAYRMGLAYFYYYNGTGNKLLSQPWFEAAKDNKKLDAAKVQRAERFFKVADYYASFANINKAGDGNASYGTYWEDMSALTLGRNIVEEDNATTALVMYKEMLSLIIMHANDFRKAGISQNSMESAITSIEASLASDFIGGVLDATLEEEYAKVQDLIKDAFEATATVYTGLGR